VSQLTDDILSSVDIVDVISRYVPLKRAGSNFSGLCPFHNEKTPSFMVSPQKQIFKCFGCGQWGNVITFVKEIEKVDFWDVVKILAKDANIDLSKYEKNYHKYEEFTQGKEKIKRIHNLAQSFFENALNKSKEAKAYLHYQRKLDDTMIKKFGLGYAPSSHYELTQFLKDKKFKNEDFVESSLAKKSQSGDVYSFFRNRIMFPIHDHMGNIIAFSARILDPNDKPKYLNSSEHIAFEKSKILYGLHIAKKHIKEHGKIIVVEGQMDVIAANRLGFPIAVATCGTALTDEHMKMLKRYTDHIFLLFDQDSAWQEATIRALRIAYKWDLFPKVISLPSETKDLDDLANLEDGKAIFEKQFEVAKDGFVTIFDILKSQSDFTSPVAKQKLFNTMFGLIIGLPNPSTQIHYLNVLAEKVGQSYEVINAQYQQFAKREGRFIRRQNKNKEKKTEIYQLKRENIVASLFANNFLGKLLEGKDGCEQFDDIAQILSSYTNDSLLTQAIQGENLEIFDEAQLWREKELQAMSDDETKLKAIKRIILPNFQNILQQIRKNKKISGEELQSLVKLMRWLGK